MLAVGVDDFPKSAFLESLRYSRWVDGHHGVLRFLSASRWTARGMVIPRKKTTSAMLEIGKPSTIAAKAEYPPRQ